MKFKRQVHYVKGGVCLPPVQSNVCSGKMD